jgi:hypothetical protein
LLFFRKITLDIEEGHLEGQVEGGTEKQDHQNVAKVGVDQSQFRKMHRLLVRIEHDRLIERVDQVDAQAHSADGLPLRTGQEPADEPSRTILACKDHPGDPASKGSPERRKIEGVREDRRLIVDHLHERVEAQDHCEDDGQAEHPHGVVKDLWDHYVT